MSDLIKMFGNDELHKAAEMVCKLAEADLVPEYVTSETVEEGELNPKYFADPVNLDYPYHNKAAAFVSSVRFYGDRHALTSDYEREVGGKLQKAAKFYGIEDDVTAALYKIAKDKIQSVSDETERQISLRDAIEDEIIKSAKCKAHSSTPKKEKKKKKTLVEEKKANLNEDMFPMIGAGVIGSAHPYSQVISRFSIDPLTMMNMDKVADIEVLANAFQEASENTRNEFLRALRKIAGMMMEPDPGVEEFDE